MTQPYEAKKFSMGVAVPLMNYKYRFGTRAETELTSDGPIYDPISGTYVFFTEALLPASINQVFRSGYKDLILVGPSSHEDNPGAREILTVSSTTYPGTFHVGTTSPAFSYKDGDPVSGIGLKLPSNWDPNTDNGTEIAPLGIYDDQYGANLVDGGVYDPYRLYIRMGYGTYLDQDMNTQLLSNTQYLFGCFYRAIFSGLCPDVYVDILYGSTRFLRQPLRRRAQGSVTDWTFFMSSLKTDIGGTWGFDGMYGVTSTVTADTCTVKLPSMVDGSSGQYTYVSVDMPFLCHAQRTSAYLRGIYTFDHFPVLGSINWSWEDQIQSVRLANGELREYDPTGGGGRVRKHTFQCNFEHVSSDFFDQINTLLMWQDEGNDLVFVTGESFYGASLPPILIGKLKVQAVNKQSWALGLRSFTFTFTET